jgi:hypothetical protein
MNDSAEINDVGLDSEFAPRDAPGENEAELSGRRSIWVAVSGCSTDAAAVSKYPAIKGNVPLVLIPLISAFSTCALRRALPKIFATSKWLKCVFDTEGNIAE